MIEIKKFKEIVENYLSRKGFITKGNYHYRIFKDLTIVIGCQKSNYAKGYYLNIGYVISHLNPELTWPKDTDGDVRARFSVTSNGKEHDFFELGEITENELLDYLDTNIERYVDKVTTVEGLRIHLQSNPVMLYQTKLSAKKFMKI